MRELIAVGDIISYRTNQGVTIQLQWIATGAYRVEVLSGGPVARPDEDLTDSYPTEAMARLVARSYAVMFTAEAEATDAAAMLKVDITDALAKAMHRRDTKRVAQLNRLADRLETPAEAALVEDVREHLTAVHTGGPALPARSFREIKARHAAALAADRKPVA